MEEPTYEGVIRLLLQQPDEIRYLVLNKLDSLDLLSLRATNHTLHQLVHGASPALCAGLSKRIAESHKLSHITMGISDLSTFFNMSSRFKAACGVAAIVAERIAPYLTSLDLRGDKTALQAWRKRKKLLMQRRLERGLIILQIYLVFMLNNMNDNELYFEPLDDETYTSLRNIFLFDQQGFIKKHMSGLTEEEFTNVTAALELLKETCKARCIPFRSKFSAHPFTSIRQILILKGLAPFTKLLVKDTSMAQQATILRRLNRQFGQHRRSYITSETESPCLSLPMLVGYWQSRIAFFDVKRSNQARDRFIANQDIWDTSARAVITQKLGVAPMAQTATNMVQKLCVEENGQPDKGVVLVGAWNQPTF